jgi:hypothetical protein
VGSSGWGDGNREVIGRTNRNGSISGHGNTGSRCRRRHGSSIGIGNISKFEQRRVVGRQRRSEPHVVIHLDLEGLQQGIWKWSMGMVETSEVGSVNRCAGKNGWWQRGKSLSRVLE